MPTPEPSNPREVVALSSRPLNLIVVRGEDLDWLDWIVNSYGPNGYHEAAKYTSGSEDELIQKLNELREAVKKRGFVLLDATIGHLMIFVSKQRCEKHNVLKSVRQLPDLFVPVMNNIYECDWCVSENAELFKKSNPGYRSPVK